MFDYKQTLTNRLADAADLMIDFATLGEYGLEPAGRTPRACEADRPRIRPATTTGQESFKEALFPNQCGRRARTFGSPVPSSPISSPSKVRDGMRRGAGAFEKQA